MASARISGFDSLITLKVIHDGRTHRVNLPLRDLLPSNFDKQIKCALNIPADTKICIERYSDSAASYVLLKTGNASVYKQLYRAAKAKARLKLRVTMPTSKVSNSTPRPITVEDEPELSLASCKEELKPASQAALPLRGSLATTSEPCPNDHAPSAKSSKPQAVSSDSINTAVTKALKKTDGPNTTSVAVKDKGQGLRLSDMDPRTKEIFQLMIADRDEDMAPLRKNTPPSDSKPARDHKQSSENSVASIAPSGLSFTVSCNHCQKNVNGTHLHCSTCDDGDFDLCQDCVDRGFVCDGKHWLIKRSVQNGKIVTSSTKIIAPKLKAAAKPITRTDGGRPLPSHPGHVSRSTVALDPVLQASLNRWACVGRNLRTCNCCVNELPERDCLHCTTCKDFDLCQTCFAKDSHGHHPKHGFVPAVANAQIPASITSKMQAGRNVEHHAICDECDEYITGVRYKCLECPDWDYCSKRIGKAPSVHANHHFAPIYEPLPDLQACSSKQAIHVGICCDGPLCAKAQGVPSYIQGVRYKCAVCHDLDFCANCEASPLNRHNDTHPLIKFKSPVQHVSVTTSGEHQDGVPMPVMGDRANFLQADADAAKSTKNIAVNAVQTVVELKPTEPCPTPCAAGQPETPESSKPDTSSSTPAPLSSLAEKDLQAIYVRDTIQDGTILRPNHAFEQTWILRNVGTVPWPAGCSVKFVGGDYMGYVDSSHPAEVSDLADASESCVCTEALKPGQEFAFTVPLRTPDRQGRALSFWRLSTPTGFMFGYRLWCQVNVCSSPVLPEEPSEPYVTLIEDVTKETAAGSSSYDSLMIFPKLEKESVELGRFRDLQVSQGVPVLGGERHKVVSDKTTSSEDGKAVDDFDSYQTNEEWESDGDFLTDEEYDILDASDETTEVAEDGRD